MFGSTLALMFEPVETMPAMATQIPAPVISKERPCFKYSITPCGVDQWTLPEGSTTETVRKPFLAFVNYRRNGRVFWTNHRVTIKAGEQVFHVGRDLVRGRCGNSISVLPMQPTENPGVSPQLDQTEAMNVPMVPNLPQLLAQSPRQNRPMDSPLPLNHFIPFQPGVPGGTGPIIGTSPGREDTGPSHTPHHPGSPSPGPPYPPPYPPPPHRSVPDANEATMLVITAALIGFGFWNKRTRRTEN